MRDHSVRKGQTRRMPALHGGGMGTPSAKGRATKIGKVGRGLTYQRVPNQDSYPELNALLQREPMEDITHVGRYMYMVKITITTLTASQGGGISARTLQLWHALV